MHDVDFGRRADDYVLHRPGFPASFYDRLERLIPVRGVEALDIGTGPGVVALELARRGAMVVGLDISHEQIAAAHRLALEQRLNDCCRFIVAPAEDTRLSPASFDLVTAGQCWTWLDAPAAMAEIMRLLRPGGWLIVAHFDYLPARSRIALLTEQLVLRHHPGWQLAGHTGLSPGLIDLLIGGGFEFVEQFCFDHPQPFTHEGWRGRMRTCNAIGANPLLTEAQVAQFDRELAAMLHQEHPEEPMSIWHRVFAVAVRRPGATRS
jgi:SAM-dependent methyltransferase